MNLGARVVTLQASPSWIRAGGCSGCSGFELNTVSMSVLISQSEKAHSDGTRFPSAELGSYRLDELGNIFPFCGFRLASWRCRLYDQAIAHWTPRIDIEIHGCWVGQLKVSFMYSWFARGDRGHDATDGDEIFADGDCCLPLSNERSKCALCVCKTFSRDE